MPAITIQSLELRDSQKEIIAKKYATILSELTNVPIDRIYVFFDGYSLNNCAKGDELFSKNPPGKLIAKFNE
jgi:phenylpyruvate tautomerase PptA (4-oxalocrotonate tautomerase family)